MLHLGFERAMSIEVQVLGIIESDGIHGMRATPGDFAYLCDRPCRGIQKPQTILL